MSSSVGSNPMALELTSGAVLAGRDRRTALGWAGDGLAVSLLCDCGVFLAIRIPQQATFANTAGVAKYFSPVEKRPRSSLTLQRQGRRSGSSQFQDADEGDTHPIRPIVQFVSELVQRFIEHERAQQRAKRRFGRRQRRSADCGPVLAQKRRRRSAL